MVKPRASSPLFFGGTQHPLGPARAHSGAPLLPESGCPSGPSRAPWNIIARLCVCQCVCVCVCVSVCLSVRSINAWASNSSLNGDSTWRPSKARVSPGPVQWRSPTPCQLLHASWLYFSSGPVPGLSCPWSPTPCRCSRVRVRRVVVPKNIQPARTKCSWTTTLTGKLSSFGFDPRRSSNFSFCFSTLGLSLTARAEAMARHASIGESSWCHKLLLNQPNFFYLKWRPAVSEETPTK